MPTRKIADLKDPGYCANPEHKPPSMMVFDPGVWEHTCPSCGRKTTFVVRGGASLGQTKWVKAEDSKWWETEVKLTYEDAAIFANREEPEIFPALVDAFKRTR